MNTQLNISNTLGNHKSDKILNEILNQNKSIYHRLINKEATLAVVGLGYVGLPLALEFAKSFNVIGFDINSSRVNLMKNHIDPSGELSAEDFEHRDIFFTSAGNTLDKADVIIVAVPTPVKSDKTPDLTPLSSACRSLASSLGKGNIVIFESTVYPGCTEEVCIPILEKVSKLKCNEDFWVGYSPERINPGDKHNTLTSITKIVSGSDDYSSKEIYDIYNHIIDAGIHMAPTIKVAEAAKIVENTQRDINIAFMNELSKIFAKMNINTFDVLKAAGTKWNFLNFYPGLVGGHCIGVDPYYLIHKGKEIGIDLDLISASRAINDGMPTHVVQSIKQGLQSKGKKLSNSKVLILGATFKENVTDLRNSKAAELTIAMKKESGQLHLIDPLADSDELMKYYQLKKSKQIEEAYDVVVYAVNHKCFEQMDWEFIKSICNENAIVFDFKRTLNNPNNDDKLMYISL